MAADIDHSRTRKAGILIVNLGTPDAPSVRAVRRYLREFLWDPRVVELSRPLWWLVLNGIILPLRPRRSAAAYAKIWSERGSPLLAYSQALTEALRAEFAARYPQRLQLELGMRYGRPSIAEALARFDAQALDSLTVLPLYPQYSATTTASVFDRLSELLRGWRWIPELRLINCYHDEPAYIEALCASIDAHWRSQGRGQRLLFSFHGIPEHYFLGGDPYPCQCRKTARLVAEQLKLEAGDYDVAFQSRFGRRPWVRPYADETLLAWARSGCRSVDVICAGFAVDCLETLEEMALQNRERFLAAGGERYRYIPALNADRAHVLALAQVLEHHLPQRMRTGEDDRERARRVERAQAHGAPG